MMKINSIFYFLLLSFLFASCGGDGEEDPMEDPMNEAVSFAATVDGAALSIATVQGLLNGPLLLISGSTSNAAEIVQVPMDSDVTTGTYPANGLSSAQYIQGTNIWSANGGTYTITKHDTDAKRIEGTFEFTASPVSGVASDVNVTNGSFKANY